jgi:hypothetical protein
MPQLHIQGMQDDRLLPDVEVSEVSLCLRGEPDHVSHELQCSGSVYTPLPSFYFIVRKKTADRSTAPFKTDLRLFFLAYYYLPTMC